MALGRVRPFYAAALELDPQTLETGSRELESRATVLYSEARQAGQWQAAFTADQINGWLALQLAEVYADALPDDISEPRVAIDDDRLTLGFRARRGGVDTVVSADATVMLTDEGDVAIRLLSVQAGSLPLPVMQVADDVSRACQELSLPVRWTQVDGQPVALVDVNQRRVARNRRSFWTRSSCATVRSIWRVTRLPATRTADVTAAVKTSCHWASSPAICCSLILPRMNCPLSE